MRPTGQEDLRERRTRVWAEVRDALNPWRNVGFIVWSGCEVGVGGTGDLSSVVILKFV